MMDMVGVALLLAFLPVWLATGRVVLATVDWVSSDDWCSF